MQNELLSFRKYKLLRFILIEIIKGNVEFDDIEELFDYINTLYIHNEITKEQYDKLLIYLKQIK